MFHIIQKLKNLSNGSYIFPQIWIREGVWKEIAKDFTWLSYPDIDIHPNAVARVEISDHKFIGYGCLIYNTIERGLDTYKGNDYSRIFLKESFFRTYSCKFIKPPKS